MDILVFCASLLVLLAVVTVVYRRYEQRKRELTSQEYEMIKAQARLTGKTKTLESEIKELEMEVMSLQARVEEAEGL